MESNGVAGTAQFGPCTGGVPAQKRRKVKYDLHQRMYVIMQFFPQIIYSKSTPHVHLGPIHATKKRGSTN